MAQKKVLEKGKQLYHGFTPKDLDKLSEPFDAKQILNVLIKKSERVKDKQWGNSLYLGYDESVPKGYIDTKNGEKSFIVGLELIDNLNYISSRDEAFAGNCGDNQVPENVQKEVEDIVGKNVGETMFMTFLGQNDYAFECFHDSEHQLEFIVPSVLISKFKVVSVTPIRYKHYEYIKEDTIKF